MVLNNLHRILLSHGDVVDIRLLPELGDFILDLLGAYTLCLDLLDVFVQLPCCLGLVLNPVVLQLFKLGLHLGSNFSLGLPLVDHFEGSYLVRHIYAKP